jgi:hypothetical protein
VRNVMQCRQLAALSILALLGVILWARIGSACSCGGTWEITDADMIFQGEAIEVHEPLHLKLGPRKAEGVARVVWGLWFAASRALDEDVRTVFRVRTVWKGRATQFVTVNTGSGLCCDCSVGKVFEEGKEYVVYAAQDDGQLHIGGCAGSAVPGTAASPTAVDSLGGVAPPPSGRRGLAMFWRHLLLPGTVVVPIALAIIIWLRSARHRRALSS